jgi:ParB-like chromosome segregation protein Spo0J
MTSAFPPGRGSQLTPDERREIQELALLAGCSQAEIGRRVHRDRQTVANVVNADDTKALAAQLQSEQREAALEVLRRAVVPMARAWQRAAEHAADRGDHRPARDLLLHTDVIEPIPDAQRTVGVQVIVGMPGHPAGPDPLAGVRIVDGIVVSDPLTKTAGKDNEG